MSDELRMDAYYYGFRATGVREIDLILCAVASAGKSYHTTDCWTDECERQNCEGKSPVEWIQNAANRAAKDIVAAQNQLSTLTAERDAAYEKGYGDACYHCSGGPFVCDQLRSGRDLAITAASNAEARAERAERERDELAKREIALGNWLQEHFPQTRGCAAIGVYPGDAAIKLLARLAAAKGEGK